MEMLHRNTLLKIGNFPVKICQWSGLYIFSVDPKLVFSLCSYPVLAFIGKLLLTIIIGFVFLPNKQKFIGIFGGWGNTEEHINLLTLISSIMSDLLCSINSFINRKSIPDFHNNLLDSVSEILTDKKERDDMENVFLSETKAWTSYVNWRAGLTFSAMVFVYIFVTIVHWNLGKELGISFTTLIFIPPVVLFWLGTTSMKNIFYFIFVSNLSYFQLGFRMLQIKCKVEDQSVKCHATSVSPEKVLWILERHRELRKLLEQFNSLFQAELISSLLVTYLQIITTSFSFCNWFSHNALTVRSLYFAVGFIYSFGIAVLAIYSLCSVASAVMKQANACTACLRNIAISTNNMEILQEIQMYHLDAVLRPPIVFPGSFFTLNRKLMVQIFSTTVTYVLVVIQFRLDDRNVDLDVIGKGN
ncbi:unnamed protein product [Orchesella dallaii]|uniref:Gustatory receptor n=1 Tax=Orchesella dallaii TaxID=48710 RepID=A0ABP1R316_9HEXA